MRTLEGLLRGLLVFLGATTAAPSTNVACLDPHAAMYALFLDSSLVSAIAHRYSRCLPSNVATIGTETYIDRDGAQWHRELCRRDGTITGGVRDSTHPQVSDRNWDSGLIPRILPRQRLLVAH